MRMRPSNGEFSDVCCRLTRNINLFDAKQRLFNPKKREHAHVTHFALNFHPWTGSPFSFTYVFLTLNILLSLQ